jgi:hypothetical protein
MKLKGQRNMTLEHDATPIQPHTEDALANHAPSHEEIRRRAYEIYLERDGLAGDALDDWLRAERELQKIALFTRDWNRHQDRVALFQMLKLPCRTRKRERDQVNDDARDFWKHGRRSPRCSRGRIHSPVS